MLEDAEIELAVDQAVVGQDEEHGPILRGLEAFHRPQDVSDEFVDQFRARLAALKMGDPLDESTGVAPLSVPRRRQILEDQVNRSVAGGAKIILGWEASRPGKRLLRTDDSDGVKKGMPAYDEELFGPVAAVIVVPDEAKRSRSRTTPSYGLGASVYTIIERGRRVAEQVEQAWFTSIIPPRLMRTCLSAGSKNPVTAAKPGRSASTSF